MTLQNNREPLLCYFKLCASFSTHCWIQTWVTVRKRSIPVKINNFFLPCDLEILWMTLKNNRASLPCYFKLCEFKLELQSGNPNLGQIRRFLEPCDLEIWRMTLQNNRAPLLCYFKLCASFRSHWWIQTGVIVRKRPIWVKFYDFFSRVTLKFDGWPCKTIGHLFYATSSFVHHFVAIGEFKLES